MALPIPNDDPFDADVFADAWKQASRRRRAGYYATRMRQRTASNLSSMENPLLRLSGWLLNRPERIAARNGDFASMYPSIGRGDANIGVPPLSEGSADGVSSSAVIDTLNVHTGLLTSIHDTLLGQRQDDKDRYKEESERAERLSEAQQMELPLQYKKEEKKEEKKESGGLFSLLAGLAGTLFRALSGGVRGFFNTLMSGIGNLLLSGFNAVFSVLKVGARLAFQGIRGLLSTGLRAAFSGLSGLLSGTLGMGATALGLTTVGAAAGGALTLGALKLIGGDAFATNAEFKKAKERGISANNKGANELSARNRLYDYLTSSLGMDKENALNIANDLQSIKRTFTGDGGGVSEAEVDSDYVEKKVQEWRDARQQKSERQTQEREDRIAARDAEMQARGGMVLEQMQIPADVMWGTGPISSPVESETTAPAPAGAAAQDGTNGRLRDSQLEYVPGGNGNERLSNAGAADAFKQLSEHAENSGVKLSLESAYRTYEEQEALFNEKGPDWAARPGNSKHGDGLAVDIAVGRAFTTPTYKWLAANAPNFGFTNTGKNFKKPEPWHWQYTGASNREVGDPVGAPVRPASTIASSSAAVSRNTTPIIINQNLMAPQNTMIGAPSMPTPIPIPIVTQSSSLAPYLAVNSI